MTQVDIAKNQTVASPIKPVVMGNDRAKLESLLIERQMINNRKVTLATQTQFMVVDDLFTSISTSEYEELINLSIEALRNRQIHT